MIRCLHLTCNMEERFLPSEDPVLEAAIKWTCERNSKDIRQLLVWLQEARSSREQKAIMKRVRELLEELEYSLEKMEQ